MKKIVLTHFIWIALLATIFSCKSRKEIDFVIFENLPIITANLNGIPINVLIDTGASTSLIDITTSGILLFKRDFDIPLNIGHGMGGATTLFGVKDAILVHETDTLDITFKGVDLSNFRHGTGIVAIIGSDFLSKNGYVVDFTSNTLKKN